MYLPHWLHVQELFSFTDLIHLVTRGRAHAQEKRKKPSPPRGPSRRSLENFETDETKRTNNSSDTSLSITPSSSIIDHT